MQLIFHLGPAPRVFSEMALEAAVFYVATMAGRAQAPVTTMWAFSWLLARAGSGEIQVYT